MHFIPCLVHVIYDYVKCIPILGLVLGSWLLVLVNSWVRDRSRVVSAFWLIYLDL